MRGDAVTLGDLVGKITLLEIACRRCERHGQLRPSRLIEQYSDIRLPELRLVLPGACPQAEAPPTSDRYSVFLLQLLATRGSWECPRVSP